VWVGVLHPCPECGGWFLTRLLHLMVGSVVVKVGDAVTKGQKLARADTTGNAHWSHPHTDLRHSPSPTANLASSFGPTWGFPFDGIAWGIDKLGPPVLAPPAWKLVSVTCDRPQIRSGAAGQPVQELQGLLVAQGFVLSVTGLFDAPTDAAVRKFQSTKGLTADGIVGAQTWFAILDY
jgi:hypothetical protein